jgi:hypothetical protein
MSTGITIRDFARGVCDRMVGKEGVRSAAVPRSHRLQHDPSGIGVWLQGKPHPIPHRPVYSGDSD